MLVERIPIESREQWLKLRRQDVTASDIGSLCGLGRRSPLSIWAEKTGRVDPTQENAMMKLGRWFESAIFTALAEEHPYLKLRRAKIYLRAVDHRIGATPDGFAVDGSPGIIVLQGKVVAKPQFREHWLEDPENEHSPVKIPIDYQLQTLTEAMLTEHAFGEPARAKLPVFIHDTYSCELKLLDIPRHDGAEQRIINDVKQFWDGVDAGLEPPVNPEKDREIVKALYPADDGTEIDLRRDNEISGIIAEWEAIKARTKIDKARKEALDTVINDKLRTASFARLPDGRRLSNKLVTRKPSYTEGSSYRQLRIVKG